MATLKGKSILAEMLLVLAGGMLNPNPKRAPEFGTSRIRNKRPKDPALLAKEKKERKAKRRETNASRRINQKLVRKKGRII